MVFMKLGKLHRYGISVFAEMTALARQYNAVNLSQGFPDFGPPPALLDAVKQVLGADPLIHQYAPMPGLPQLRKTLCKLLAETLSLHLPDEDHITITSGATQAIFSAISTWVNKGDRVIVFAPAYDSYVPGIEANGGIPVEIHCRIPQGEPDWDMFRDLLTHSVKAIIVNTPHNPLASVWKPHWWNTMYEILQEKFDEENFPIIISDEVYAWITFDDIQHFSVLNHPGLKNHAIACFSFGKLFHSTGWKLGFAASVSKHLMEEFRKVHQFIVFSSNSVLQHAIYHYLTEMGGIEDIKQLRGLFQHKRDRFMQLVSQSGLKWFKPEGSYFILADYSEVFGSRKDLEVARELTVKAGVAPIPLSPFYQNPPADLCFLRFCFAKKDSTLEEGANRLIKYAGRN